MLNRYCDVLVIGAGPAGSACALRLAQEGRSVLLVDQYEMPREKVCGDALIPDALSALHRLGLYERVMDKALQLDRMTLVGPRNRTLEIPASVAVLQRIELDEILCSAAIQAGADFQAPYKFKSLMFEGERVVGARFTDWQSEVHEVKSRWVVLATGAQPHPLQATGLIMRKEPSAVAIRGYISHPRPSSDLSSMHFVCNKSIGRGYGWIFPAPNNTFNIGVGVFLDGKNGDEKPNLRQRNLHKMFDAFCKSYEPAARLVREGHWTQSLRGAPLRCSLQGIQPFYPGLLLTGEAAGSTYSLSGEGIGKALETGMLCAQALLSNPDNERNSEADQTICKNYQESLNGLSPRYKIYDRATQVFSYPLLIELLIWRAQRSPKILNHVAGLFNETSDPSRIFSWRALRRIVLG